MTNDSEKRFREELQEAVATTVHKWFEGRDLIFPVMKSSGENRDNPIRKQVGISKVKLADFVYNELLKQIPWLAEYEK